MATTNISGLLIDLSGTIYIDDEMVPGTQKALDVIRRSGVPVRFVSNTTSKPRSAILKKLAGFDLKIDETEVFTATIAADQFLKRAGFRKCNFLLKEEVLSDITGCIHSESDPEAVVVGDLGEEFTYDRLNRAFNNLVDGAELFALAQNRYFEKEGMLQIDVGGFVAALEYSANCKSRLIGKPSRTFFEAAAGSMEVDHSRIAMVGDDIEADCKGAMDAGMHGILVKTGKYRADLAYKSGITPTATLNSVADLPEYLGLK